MNEQTVTLPDGSTVSASSDLLARAARAVDRCSPAGPRDSEAKAKALLVRCGDVRSERRAGRDGLAIAEEIVGALAELPRWLAVQVQQRLSQCLAAIPLSHNR